MKGSHCKELRSCDVVWDKNVQPKLTEWHIHYNTVSKITFTMTFVGGCSGLQLKLSYLSSQLGGDLNSRPCGATHKICDQWWLQMSGKTWSYVFMCRRMSWSTWKFPGKSPLKMTLGNGRNWSKLDSHFRGSQVKLHKNPSSLSCLTQQAHSIEWRYHIMCTPGCTQSASDDHVTLFRTHNVG